MVEGAGLVKMMAVLFIIAALWLFVWWLRFTLKTFSAVAVCLWRVAIELRHLIRIITRPRCSLLDEFLAKRRSLGR
jgi:hypothetical protein